MMAEPTFLRDRAVWRLDLVLEKERDCLRPYLNDGGSLDVHLASITIVA